MQGCVCHAGARHDSQRRLCGHAAPGPDWWHLLSGSGGPHTPLLCRPRSSGNLQPQPTKCQTHYVGSMFAWPSLQCKSSVGPTMCCIRSCDISAPDSAVQHVFPMARLTPESSLSAPCWEDLVLGCTCNAPPMDAGFAEGDSNTRKDRAAQGELAPRRLQCGGTGLTLHQDHQGAAAAAFCPLKAANTPHKAMIFSRYL